MSDIIETKTRLATQAAIREVVKPEYCLAGGFNSLERTLKRAFDLCPPDSEARGWISGAAELVYAIEDCVRIREESSVGCPTCAIKPWPETAEQKAEPSNA